MRRTPSLLRAFSAPLVLLTASGLLGCGDEPTAVAEPQPELSLQLEVLSYTGQDGLDRFYYRATATNVGMAGAFSLLPCGDAVVSTRYADGTQIQWSNPCWIPPASPSTTPCPLLRTTLKPGESMSWEYHVPGSVWVDCETAVPNPARSYTATWEMTYYEDTEENTTLSTSQIEQIERGWIVRAVKTFEWAGN
jgi:hypothetical protein